MKKTPKPVGRPTFRIDGGRLRSLREEASLSQRELAQRVYDRAGKGYASLAVQKNSAQRWESTGALPADMAKHLADELRTTVAVLQGSLPEPAPSKIDEIEARLRQLIANGPCSRLRDALARWEPDENAPRELAMQITERLEVAQLSHDEKELEDLATLTGYSSKELREPTSFVGLWMFFATGTLGPARTEILSGISEVRYAVKTEMETALGGPNDGDAHISFSEEKHWFCITITHPRLKQLVRTLRFVRCQPKENGLQWTSPTWQDKFWLKDLQNYAYNLSSFVTGFDSVCVPSDCRCLRFAIAKVPSLQERERLGPDASEEILELFECNLLELPAETLFSFTREGSSHLLAVNWLTSNLWEKLLPYMADWPLECWQFRLSQRRIDLILDVPYRLYAKSKVPLHFGNRFSVGLVEIFPEGGMRTAPWPQKSVATVHKRLTECLHQALESEQQAATHHGLAP